MEMKSAGNLSETYVHAIDVNSWIMYYVCTHAV